MRLRVSIFTMIGWLAGIMAGDAQQPFPSPVKGDRILVVAPHPDDEVLGAGGLIQQAVAVGAEVRVIYLTNGDHNQVAFKLYSHHLLHLRARQYIAFGKQRRDEAIAATHRLGLQSGNLTFLGYPDWGTLAIWRDYWEPGEVFTSDATRTNAVPYPENYGYQHLYKPQAIVVDLSAVLREFKPTRVFVTHPADTNRDHRAAANFVRLALLQLAGEGIRPEVCYYVIHFGYWPRPLHYHPAIEIEPPRALLDDGEWRTLALTHGQTETKYRAILENRTQLAALPYNLEAFARANELFATIKPDAVPYLPSDQPLDWRKAVRAKAIDVVPVEHAQHLNGAATQPVPTTSVVLDHVDFLRQNGDLIALVQVKDRLGKRTGVHLYLYAYKHGADFALMPKVEVHITMFGALRVYAGGQRVNNHGATFTSVANRLFVRVPMSLLGGTDIDCMFTATRAHLGEIAPDDTAWQLFTFGNTTYD